MYLQYGIYMHQQSTCLISQPAVQYSKVQYSLTQVLAQHILVEQCSTAVYHNIHTSGVILVKQKYNLHLKTSVPGFEVITLLEHVLMMKFEKQDSHSPPQISRVPRSMQYQNGAEKDTVQDTKVITVATNPVTLYRPIADPQNTCRPN